MQAPFKALNQRIYNMYARCIKSLNKANKHHIKRSIKQVTIGNVTCFYYGKMEMHNVSTNDYIRQAAQKYHWYKYYSVMRPVSIGTHPKDGMMDFINYDTRTEVNGRMVWGELYYNRELTQKETEDFEMIRG